MKLNYFTQQTLPPSQGRKSFGASVTFSKQGLITFYKAAVKLLSLTPGMKLSLAQDEETPEDWYFFYDPANGFILREDKNESLVFSHKALIHALFECFDFDASETKRFLLAGQPTEMKGSNTKYWCILIQR